MGVARRASDRADTKVLQALAFLKAGKFADVRAALRDDSGDAELRVHAIAGDPDAVEGLHAWRAEAADDPDLHLLSAVRRLDDFPWVALELEGRRDEQQQYYDEVETLWRAVDHLQLALTAEPDRAVARVWLAAVVGALAWRGAVPTEDFNVCARSAEQASPNSLIVTRWRIHVAEAEADTEALAIAEDLAKRWPAGDARHGEIGTAHLASYRDLLDSSVEDAQRYWERDAVVQSMVAADERFGDGDGSLGAMDASNVFAFVLPRTPRPRLGIPHFERMDGRLLTWPWTMMRSPAGAYEDLRQRARARAIARLLGR